MKSFMLYMAVSLLTKVDAFPFIMDPNHPINQGGAAKGGEMLETRKTVPFDDKEQFRSNSGKHRFIAPTATDTRGPCPGLNVMSNHGYLPRNGEGTIEQFSEACQYVYGMSASLAIFLSTFGATMDGNLLAWNVGGKPHTGISGAHANYESDSSIMRGDLHQYGNSDALRISQFKQLYDLQPDPKTADYDRAVMTKYRRTRFDQSVSGNPVFFFEPFSGIEVTAAGFDFTTNFFSNKSREHPTGRLDKNVLKSFYSIYEKPNGELYWKPGYERIPDNWYTRNKHDKYSAVNLQEAILTYATETPEAITVGCNVAGTNSYDVIDTGEMSGGTYNAADVAKKPLCFSMEYARANVEKEIGLRGAALSALTSAIDGVVSELGGCNKFADLNLKKLKGCPGFSVYGGPKGAIAPGAKNTA